MLKSNVFENKGYRSEEKFSAHSFSYYPLWQTSSNLLLSSTRYFGIYGPCCKIISVKRLSTEKGPFEYVGLNRKTVWRDFRQKREQKQYLRPIRNTSSNKRPLNTRYFGKYCASYKIISSGTKRLLKTKKNLRKKQTFQWIKYFGLIFLALSSVKNLKGHLIGAQKVMGQILWKL